MSRRSRGKKHGEEDGLDSESDHDQNEPNKRSKKILAPVEFVQAINKREECDVFAVGSRGKGGVALKRAADDLGVFDDQKKEIQDLKEELALMKALFKSKGVDATIKKGIDFRSEFGVDLAFFEKLYLICEPWIPGDGQVNVFTPPSNDKKHRARPVGVSKREGFGILFRRICKCVNFTDIGAGKAILWC
jgi:hypothetical protein